MRREEAPGIFIGVLLTAIGLVVTALAIKYATDSLLWDVILALGIAIAVMAVVDTAWAIFASSSELRKSRPLWGPMILVDLGICLIVGAIVWHFNDAPEKELNGFTSYSVIRLYDSPETRKRYVYEFVTSGGAKAAFYLSGSSQFTFQITDVNGDAYPIEVRVGGNGLPIDRWIALFCEAGVSGNTTLLRVTFNNHEVGRREIPAAIPLGKLDWHAGSLGAPSIGANQGGIFMLFEIGAFGSTIIRTKKAQLVTNISAFLKQPFD
jgi:hypothetical protein